MLKEFEFELDVEGLEETIDSINKCKTIPEQALRKANDYVVSEVILDTPVKTGRLRKGWHNALMRAQERPIKRDGDLLIIEDENTTVYGEIVEYGGLDDWGNWRAGTYYTTNAVARAEANLGKEVEAYVSQKLGYYLEDNKGLSKDKLDFYSDDK